jgi:hypothetical protein
VNKELRLCQRVDFEKGIEVQIMGIDGTWRRSCKMLDISANGVLLGVEGPVAGLDLHEFFLLLSSNGLAHRRCELVRLSGNQIGARFLKADTGRKKSASPSSRREVAAAEH